MGLIAETLSRILKQQSVGNVASELVLFSALLWIAVVVGLVAGWAWRPRWAAGLIGVRLGRGGDRSSSRSEREREVVEMSDGEELAVTSEDLEHLCKLVDETDGGPAWQLMMEKTMPGFRYKAWMREPEMGPLQYRTSTIFNDANPAEVRDFFWDDEFRMSNKWDGMLLQHDMLEECMETGTIVVRWVRKFPFFCSDREYIIGRRIWNANGTYYCITKGVPRPSIPRRNKPRRVDLYYSSFCVRPVESKAGDNQMSACEVLLFHHEEMGIPRKIAKFGVKQGMWGCVRKIETGLRAYQTARSQGESPSKYASMAQINTNVQNVYLIPLERKEGEVFSESEEIVQVGKQKPQRSSNIPKFLIVGGAVAVACVLDRRLLTKAVIFGAARKFGKLGG